MKRRTLLFAGAGSATALSAAYAGDVSSDKDNAAVPPSAPEGSDKEPQKFELGADVLGDKLPSGEDIAAGRLPLRRDEDAWSSIIKVFHELYGPVPQIDGIASEVTKATGYDPKLSVMDLQYKEALYEPFVYNQVDLLLLQASDLLNRCLETGEQYKEKLSRSATLALEIASFLENDAIHKDEIAAGIYTTPYEVSSADDRAQTQKVTGFEAGAFFTKASLDEYFTSDKINFYGGHSQLLSWLSTVPQYEYPNVGNPRTLTWNGKPDTSSKHAITATAALIFRNYGLENYALSGQWWGQVQAGYSAKSTLVGTRAKSKWDYADIDFKRRRTQAARDIADRKVVLATTPGGALNFAEQADTHRKRLVRDLVDAISRLVACEKGLTLIYGRNIPLPVSAKKLIEEGALAKVEIIGFLEDAANWVRNAIGYVSAFGMRDQGYTLSVSVRQLIGTTAWRKGRLKGEWEINLDAKLFPDQFCVRLRGANIFARGTEGLWNATLTIPRSSYYERADGSASSVDQTIFPPLRIGKVGARSAERYHEIFGTVSLRNAAPFGKWVLQIGTSSTHEEPRSAIADIEIDFEIQVRAKG